MTRKCLYHRSTTNTWNHEEETLEYRNKDKHIKVRKPVFRVSDKARLKSVSSATETS